MSVSVFNDDNKVLISSTLENMHFAGKATYVSSLEKLHETINGYPWSHTASYQYKMSTPGWGAAHTYTVSTYPGHPFYTSSYENFSNPRYTIADYAASGFIDINHLKQESRMLRDKYYFIPATTSGSCIHTYSFDTLETPLVFIKPIDYDKFYGIIEQRLESGIWIFKVLQSGLDSTPPELYVFTPPSAIDNSDHKGLQVFLADGKEAFNSNKQPLNIIAGGVSQPPEKPNDGDPPIELGFPTTDTATYPYTYLGTQLTFVAEAMNGRKEYGNQHNLWNWRSDSSYTSSSIPHDVTPTNLMFAAPSLAQSVLRGKINGLSFDVATGVGGGGGYIAGVTNVYSTAQWWAMYRNVFRIRPVGFDTVNITYITANDAFTSRLEHPDLPQKPKVYDLLYALPIDWYLDNTNSVYPVYVYIWLGAQWSGFDRRTVHFSAEYETTEPPATVTGLEEGHFYVSRASTIETMRYFHYREGVWEEVFSGSTHSEVGTLHPNTSLHSGWTPFASGYAYEETHHDYTWAGALVPWVDHDTGTYGTSELPYQPKTINLQDNAYLIADSSLYD